MFRPRLPNRTTFPHTTFARRSVSSGIFPSIPMRRFFPLVLLAVLPGCYTLFPSVRDRAIDGCREQAISEGWRVQGVEDVRREGTAQRVTMKASKLLLGTRSVVCYFDPATSRATIN